MGIIFLIPAIFFLVVVILIYVALGDLRPTYRVASRTYLVSFLLQIVIISSISEEQLVKIGFKLGSGIGYLMAILTVPELVLKSIAVGKGNDYLALLLLPVFPSIIALLINKRQNTEVN
ncbi:hypothetical protein [uncultured Hymenobacter sp.]|uniref:hypothetical protein n=1 Tax=uncultured Hymenobacter sp. TaxID=170016 RepID=UPI0035CC5529